MDTHSVVPTPLQAFVAFFDADDWRFTVDSAQRRLNTGVELQHCKCRITVGAAGDARRVSVIAALDTLVPDDCRTRVAEYLMRANRDWSLGHFELDFADGAVISVCTIPVEDGVVSATMAREAVLSTAFLMDRYYPGLMRVIYGGQEPAAEVQRVRDEP